MMAKDSFMVGPSLPPFVEGQLRCFLHCSIGDVKWIDQRLFKNVQIAVKWWGQQSKDILLEPKGSMKSKGDKLKNEVKYPIRSGPKQFTAYLQDMGVLSLGVLSNGQTIGEVHINDIGHLCHSQPVQGFYPITGTAGTGTGKEIGRLFVSLAFHSVSGSFNMTSSTIPTTDMSTPQINKKEQLLSKLGKGKSTAREKKKSLKATSSKDKKDGKRKEVKISSFPSKRVEYLETSSTNEESRFVDGPGRLNIFEKPKEKIEELHTSHQSPNNKDIPPRSDVLSRDKSPRTHHSPQLMNDDERDLLAALIERGKDLRNRMLVSTIDALNAEEEKKPRDKFEGNLLQDILEQVDEGDTIDDTQVVESPIGQMTYPVEKNLVDLVTGDEHHNISRILKRLDRNSDESISDAFSDVEDPVHEESLINDLFFTKKLSGSDESSVMLTDDSADEIKQKEKSRRLSLEDPGNKRPKRHSADKNEGKPKIRQNRRRATEVRENDASVISGNDSMAYMDVNASQSGAQQSSQDNGVIGKEAEGVSVLESLIPEGMDLDTITALARVQFARVIIHQLELKKDWLETYGHSTFFVEYEFPVSSKDAAGTFQSGTEVIRCASSKTHDNSVIFNHRSVFPVHFDGLSLERWWEKRIIFKVFARSPGIQTPSLLGKQRIYLQHLFLADNFTMRERIRIKRDSIHDANEDKENPEGFDEIGDLLVSMELESDKADVKTKTTDSKSAAVSRPPLNHMKIEMRPVKDATMAQTNPTTHLMARPKVETMQVPTDRPPKQATRHDTDKEVLLHSLLYIPEGRCICKDSHHGLEKPLNCYMVFRMFWDEEASRSRVCWSSLDPQFDFMQTIPVMLKESLLERTRNNFMVIEIWNKSLSAENDELIGIVKISLHPFYLSFKDQGVVKTLLKSQYPVTAIDGLVAIQNLFSGSNCGQLQVLLALGTPEQISNLVKMKDRAFEKKPESPVKCRDRERIVESKHSQVNSDVVEYIFGISVDSANKLVASDMTDTNEKDCFIQYQFPEQKQKETDFPLVWYKSPTTLFVENPIFGYSHKHTFTSSPGKSIQNFLLTGFNSASSSKSSGMLFELWQRSYYPNIRDCLLYKTAIPLAKLRAMVTMAKYKDSSFQSFKLPLSPVNIPSDESIDNDEAVLNVTVNYQQRQISLQDVGAVESKNPFVCLSVSILRACGLKAYLHNQRSKKHQLANIPLSGFNTFIRVSLSFLGMDSVRTSQVIARSFAPTFSYHVDFPMSVIEEFLETDESDETSTLAYQLESGYIQVQIFHKQMKSGFMPGRGNDFEDESAELLLGVCKIPLTGLLACHTGIKGWYPIKNSQTSNQTKRTIRSHCDADEMDCNVGGLEVAMKFGNATDRELIINTARGMGWSPLQSVDIHEDSFVDSDLHENVCLNAVINIDKFWISRGILENFRDGDLGDLREFKIYCRYKFYDHGALKTKLTTIGRSISSDLLSADLKHKKNLILSKTSALSWYLREEIFEIQFWLKMLTSNESSVTQKRRDKLIGSAYLDASRIAKISSMKGSVSGLYPIYKFGADFLGKSCVRMSLNITDSNETDANSSSVEDETFSSSYPLEKDSEIHGQGMEKTPNEAGKKQRTLKEERAKGFVDEFDVLSQEEKQDPVIGTNCRIIVEEALHLSLVDDCQGKKSPPTTYISYQLTPFHDPTYTSIVLHSTKPRWNLEKIERIDPDKVINQSINFKLYRKSDSSDIHPDASKDVLIGTAVVDVSLLKSGFRQIHGWYNITDFTGHCVGQIKVGVIPEKPVSTSPSARYFRKEVLAEKIYSAYPNFVPHMAPLLLDNGSEIESVPATDLCRKMPLFERQDAQEKNSAAHSFSDSSKSMLFHKLRDQMDDLDSLNKILRDKLKSEDSDLHLHTIKKRACIQSEHSESGSHEALDSSTVYSDSTKRDKPVRDTGVPDCRGVDYDAFLAVEDENIHKEPDVLKNNYQDECLELDGNPIDSSFQIEGITSDKAKSKNDFCLDNAEPEPQGADKGRGDAFVPSEQSFSVTDRISVSPDFQEDQNAFDSFDDVLEDWKKYRSNTDKDDLVIEINPDRSISDGYICGNESASDKENDTRDIDAVYCKPLPLNQVHGNIVEKSAWDKIRKDDGHFEAETDIIMESDNSTNGIEADIIREITRNILQPSDAILRTKVNDGEVKDIDNELSNQDDVGDPNQDNHSIADDGDDDNKHAELENSSNSRHQESSSDNTSRIPNFFMPPERLAQSMQKLRLSASHGRSPEYIEDSDDEMRLKSHRKDSKDLERQFERRKKFYGTKNIRLSLDKPPPLQSTEMNRIASIFASKFQS